MADTLPKVKHKKLINITEFTKLAKKVTKSIEEEREYLRKRNERNEYDHSSRLYSIT